MSDVDVKIGLSVQGDASGAQQVTDALKQVAGSVRELGNADNGKLESTDESIKGLVESLSGISKENAKGAVDGLTRAILGITQGNVQQGISGLSTALFGLSYAIPIPGVAIASAAALSSLAMVFKDVWQGGDDATSSLNDFGETLDAEMIRLSEWQKVKVEWENVIGANKRLRDDFDTTQKAADSAMSAITKVIDAKTGSQVSSLKQQAADAEQSGDKARADELNAAADRVAQRAELVKLNLIQAVTKDKIDRQTELLQNQVTATKTLEEKLAQSSAELSAMEKLITDKTGSTDFATDEDKRKKTISRLEGDIKSKEMDISFAEQQKNFMTDPDVLEAFRLKVEETKKEIEEIKALIDAIRNYAKKLDDSSKAQAELDKQRSDQKKEEAEAANILRDLNAQKTTADLAAKDLSASVGPSVSQSASNQAAALYAASKKELDAAGDAIGPAIAKIAEEASAEIDRLTTDPDSLEKQLADVKGKIYNAFSDGEDFSALQTKAQQIYAALELLGRAGELQSPDEYVQSLIDSSAQITSAISQEAAAASAVKEQIVQIAAGTKESMTASAKQLSDAGAVLVGLGSLFGSAVNSLSEAVTAASRTAERALAAANRASTASDLALSQIRNMPR